MYQALLERFGSLFRGNPRCRGSYDPEVGASETVQGSPTDADIRRHLDGNSGIGVVPVLDDGTCYFGAIDIDAHGDQPDVDLVALERDIRRKGLPLTVCRSKSGGAHVYLFGLEPLKAAVVRKVLAQWASDLGYPGVEIFPKQSKLAADAVLREAQNGNWINLPYFDAAQQDRYGPDEMAKARYAVEAGERVSLAYFLQCAEQRAITQKQLLVLRRNEHDQAPPCIQRLYRDGVDSGDRNNALYNVVVYLKRAFPADYVEKAHDFNANRMDNPLGHMEAKKLIASAGRRDYKYRCSDRPLCDLCDSKQCTKRKYGISADDKYAMDSMTAPEYNGLVEVLGGDEDRWVLVVNGTEIELSHGDLMNYRSVRALVVRRLKIMPPMLKQQDWDVILANLLQNCETRELPQEATRHGMMTAALDRYLNQADLHSDGEFVSDRIHLRSDIPVVQNIDGEVVVLFQFAGFHKALQQERLPVSTKTPDVLQFLQAHGAEPAKVRVGGKPMRVWKIPVSMVEDHQITDEEMKEIEDREGYNEF